MTCATTLGIPAFQTACIIENQAMSQYAGSNASNLVEARIGLSVRAMRQHGLIGLMQLPPAAKLRSE